MKWSVKVNETRSAVRVATRLLSERVAFFHLSRKSKERPSDLFGQTFFDLREKVKALKEEWSQEARTSLEKKLISDLKGRGLDVVSVSVVLGKYKGSRFVTSAKVHVRIPEKEVKALEAYLQAKWSPKFRVKSTDGEIVEFNVR